MLHTVFSVDGSHYHRWQADLLAYSHRRVEQPGTLTRLFSSNDEPSPFAGETFWTISFSRHRHTSDFYPPYNKPAALAGWVTEIPLHEDDTVLICDPDFIFVQSIADYHVERGRPIAQPSVVLRLPEHSELIQKHCKRPELVVDVDVPFLFTVHDLRLVAPLWAKKTEEIRHDARSREQSSLPC